METYIDDDQVAALFGLRATVDAAVAAITGQIAEATARLRVAPLASSEQDRELALLAQFGRQLDLWKTTVELVGGLRLETNDLLQPIGAPTIPGDSTLETALDAECASDCELHEAKLGLAWRCHVASAILAELDVIRAFGGICGYRAGCRFRYHRPDRRGFPELDDEVLLQLEEWAGDSLVSWRQLNEECSSLLEQEEASWVRIRELHDEIRRMRRAGGEPGWEP